MNDLRTVPDPKPPPATLDGELAMIEQLDSCAAVPRIDWA